MSKDIPELIPEFILLWSLTTQTRACQVARLGETLIFPYLGHSKSEICKLPEAHHCFELPPRTQGCFHFPNFGHLNDPTDVVDATGIANYKMSQGATCGGIIVEIGGQIGAHFVSRNGSSRPQEMVIAFNKRNPQPGDVVLNVYNSARTKQLGRWALQLMHTRKFRKLFPSFAVRNEKTICGRVPAVPFVDHQFDPLETVGLKDLAPILLGMQVEDKVIDDAAHAVPIDHKFDALETAGLDDFAPILLGMQVEGQEDKKVMDDAALAAVPSDYQFTPWQEMQTAGLLDLVPPVFLDLQAPAQADMMSN